MRTHFVVVILLIPVALAAEHQDPAGDSQANPQFIDSGFVDLTGMYFDANETHLQVTIDAPTGTDPSSNLAQVAYRFKFMFRGENFMLDFFGNQDPLNEARGNPSNLWESHLLRLDASAWTLLATYASADLGAELLGVEVPWSDVRTSADAYPLPGSVLGLARFESQWSPTLDTYEPDAEPSNVAAWDEYVFQSTDTFRVPGGGDAGIAAFTEAPVRFSNGQATTFYFPILLESDTTQRVELHATYPDRFEVTFQESFTLQAGAEVTLPMYVRTPFAHAHGSIEEVRLEFVGSNGVAVLPVSINYPTVPQPAGHHNVLYLHGIDQNNGNTFPGDGAFMNTMRDDERSSASFLEAGQLACELGTRNGGQWTLPLQPELVMGLDARVDEPAHLLLDMQWQQLAADGELFANLVLRAREDPETFAAAEIQQWSRTAVTGASNQEFTVDLEIPVPAALDHVGPSSAQNLELWLAYCPKTIQGINGIMNNPLLLPGSSLELPLNEFHDVLPIPSTSNVRLETNTPQYVAAPGANLLWTIQASSSSKDDYNIRLIGAHQELAVLQGDGQIRLDTPQEILLTFRVPENAVEGDLYEVVVTAQSRQTLGDEAAVRLTVIVNRDAETDHMQEIGRLQPSKDLASPGLLLSLGALVVVALHRNRRL